MPYALDVHDAEAIEVWPLGKVMTAKASGQGWTDVLLILDDAIRLGGKHNSRRVRYNGRFYITHNKRRVYLCAELAHRVLEMAAHVYGIDSEQDALHNATLKGY